MLDVMLIQASETWHHQGLYMGMHWGWWLFWIVVLLIVVWAFWRLFAERSEVHREATGALQAEEALRERFARGEIDEDEFAHRLKVLQESRRYRVLAPSHEDR